MIVREFYEMRFDGVKLYKTYSSEGMKIHKVGTDEVYDDAIDIEGAPYIYEETDEPIAVAEQPQEEVNA